MKTLHALSRGGQLRSGGYRSGITDKDMPEYDGKAVSEEEYWEKYYNHPDSDSDFEYEWNNGILEAKPMADVKSSRMYQWFCDISRCYSSTYPIGTIVNLEIGFRLALPHKTSIRKPDMAIVLNNNIRVPNDDDASYSGIFDLCVEILSYSAKKEIRRDTVEKKEEYEGGGVGEYYILDARKMETAFYRLNKRGKYGIIRPAKGGIICSAVLPEFRFRIADLYRQPSLEEMAEDEVYNHYVFPSYKEAKQQVEHEKLRAEQAEENLNREKQRTGRAEKKLKLEKQRMVQEKQRADRLASKLRELGISPELI